MSEQPKAHQSFPPRAINVDETGISMSWKTAVAIISFVVATVATAAAFSASLVRKDDLRKHDEDPMAHPVELASQKDKVPVAQAVRSLELQATQLSTQMREQTQAVADQTAVMNEDRADRAADTTVAGIRDPGKRLEAWKRARAKAMDNIRKNLPIRDGLD